MSEKPDILSIVTHYVPLIGKGSVHRGYCPFCHSQSDNLFIRPDIQEWHCFECGAGGDVFEFVERIENIARDDVPNFIDRLLRGEVVHHVAQEPEPAIASSVDPRVGEFFSRLRDIKGYIGAAIFNEQGRIEHVDHLGLIEPQFARLFPLLRGVVMLSDGVVQGMSSSRGNREIVFSSENGAIIYLEIPISGEIRTLMISLEDRARATMARHYGYALRNQDDHEKTMIMTQLPQ